MTPATSPPALRAAPIDPADDPVLRYDARRRADALASVLEAAAAQMPDAAAEQVRSWRALLGGLDDVSTARVVQEPRYGFWWSRLRGLLRGGSRPGIESWLAHLPRFLTVPAATAGALDDTPLLVPLDARGDLRLGGMPAHVALAGRGAAELRAAGDRLVVSADGREWSGPLGALLRGEAAPGVVPHATLLSGRIEIDASDPWLHDLFADLRAQPAEPPYPQRDAEPCETVSPELVALYEDALALIGRAWPELLREIAAHVHLVVPFRSGLLEGWAHTAFRGAIFVRAAGDLRFAVERLAHEAAHVRLYVMSFRRLHENAPGDVFRSPLRLDPRPASGILHGVFVHARLIQLYDRAEAVLGDRSFAARAAELRPRLAAGLETLRTQARLTGDGAALLDELAAAADAGAAPPCGVASRPART